MAGEVIYRGNYRGEAPVEYAVAVDRYLGAARISDSSRRVYRVALGTWAWLLIDRTPPAGAARRGAAAPTLLLARLDGASAGPAVRSALTKRALMVDARTFAREASILRNAAHWWSSQGWITPDAEAAVRAQLARPAAPPPSMPSDSSDLSIDASAVFALRVPLREMTLWRLVYESSAPLELLLALDASDLDFARRRVRRLAAPRPADRVGWGPATAELLPLLTIGRGGGPVFLTARRAPERTPRADRCPYTGRARLSSRRAAELFQAATRELDPSGTGWNLRDLRLAGRAATVGPGRTATAEAAGQG